MMMFALLTIFAQGGNAPAPGANPGGGLGPILPVILIVAAAMYFLFYLPSKRERARQAALLAGIKKNDHVVTASGIYGVVTDVSKDTNKVTLRIDESTGAKIRMELTAVVRVLGDEPAADASPK
jgi:preprotein translocase subunit YajC